MYSITRQIAPCNFLHEDHSNEPIKLNFTEHFKRMIQNKVWERAYEYGFGDNLKRIEINDIKCIHITIYPKVLSNSNLSDRHHKNILTHCGDISPDFLIKCTSDIEDSNGLIVIEIERYSEIKNMINTGERFTPDFLELYNVMTSILNEVSAFLLAGLNLLFPTNSLLMDREDSIRDGFVQIESLGKKYFNKQKTDKFTHQILIKTDSDNHKNLEFVFDLLSKTWHKNLWSLRRYLIAVDSSRISMDNLLDLIYALEGLFKNNASTDFIKLMVCVQFSDNKQQAIDLKEFLDLVFKTRNEMVHGGKTFNQIEKVKFKGKEIMMLTLYWEMKRILSTLIIRALIKIQDSEQKVLRYNAEDMWDKVYT